jgi:hypothetical protein
MSNIISLSKAVTETHNYQNDPRFQGLTKSLLMDALAYYQLLAQPNVVGVRTYFAIDNEVLTIVVVGVDIHGEDCTQGLILGNAEPCPFSCPTNSPLL